MTKIIKVYSKVHGEHDVLVDDEDYERVVPYAWWISKGSEPTSKTLYAQAKISRRTAFIHRLILGLEFEDGKEVDHINGNGLDNRRENLRIASRIMQTLNTERSRNARLIEKYGKRFYVRFSVNGARVSLGAFDTEQEAQVILQEYLRCNPR